MLTTTFLLATAVATAAVLALMLSVRKPDDVPVRVGHGAYVVAIAAALAALGWAIL